MARNIIKVARGTSAKLTATPFPAVLQEFEPVFMTDGAKSFGIVVDNSGTKTIEWIGIDASKLTKGTLNSDLLGNVPHTKISVAGATNGNILIVDSLGGVYDTSPGNITVATALDAEKLDGQAASFYRDASNINAGKIGYAYLPVGMGSNQVAPGQHTHDVTTLSVGGGATGDILYRDGDGKVGVRNGNFYLTPAQGNAAYLGIGAKAADSNKLNGQEASYYRNATNINAGTLNIARIPTGTTSSTVALGDHNHDSIYIKIDGGTVDGGNIT